MSDASGHTFTLRLSMWGDGTLGLSERSRERTGPHGGYENPKLLDDAPAKAIEFTAYVTTDSEEDDDPLGHVRVSMHATHVENTETGRVFHADLRYRLSYVEAARLRDWLDLAVKHWEE